MNHRQNYHNFDAASAISGGLTAIGGTLVGVQDAKQRAAISESLGKLSIKQQERLNEQMLQAQSQNQRLALMLSAVQQSKENPYLYDINKRKYFIIGLSVLGALALGGMFIFLKYKKG